MAKKKKDADTDAAAPAADESAAPKKKSAVLPAIVVAIAVLGGGAMAGGLVGGGGDAAVAGPAPEPEPTAVELGVFTDLDAITLNLAGGEGHFLKVEMSVETDIGLAEVPPLQPVYDIALRHFGGYSYDDLRNISAREQAQDDLLSKVEAVYGTDITGVFYRQFVMQ